jgi:hypothetical protein
LGVAATQAKIADVLRDGKAWSSKDIAQRLGLSRSSVESCLGRMWRSYRILRSAKPVICSEKTFRGRLGMITNQRQYYSYLLGPEGGGGASVIFEGQQYVAYSEKYLDKRGGGGLNGESKSKLIREFIEKNSDRAFFSKELTNALKHKGIKPSDIMTTVRRLEKKGLVYVRGYRLHDGQTPFGDGYLLTWLDNDTSREDAIEQAIKRTGAVLRNTASASTHPIIERIHLTRDTIIEATKLRDLASFEYLHNKMGCSKYEAKNAISRALQLYPDLREIKLFNAFNYYYHTSMAEMDLKAATFFKQNYLRQIKGKQNRLGHNWEATVEWFVDKFTQGAVFQTQRHRTKGMDPRRITLHLVKSVGSRKNSAEVDRVWSVSMGLLLKPVTYVLECKWGVISKSVVDDFLEVLRWSTEFGVDTFEGRQIKQRVVCVFAGSAFDSAKSVDLENETKITTAAYAARINIKLIKTGDLNQKMRERGLTRELTVQSVCRIAKNEKEVRNILTLIWESPDKAKDVVAKVAEKNKTVYAFERMLEEDKED